MSDRSSVWWGWCGALTLVVMLCGCPARNTRAASHGVVKQTYISQAAPVGSDGDVVLVVQDGRTAHVVLLSRDGVVRKKWGHAGLVQRSLAISATADTLFFSDLAFDPLLNRVIALNLHTGVERVVMSSPDIVNVRGRLPGRGVLIVQRTRVLSFKPRPWELLAIDLSSRKIAPVTPLFTFPVSEADPFGPWVVSLSADGHSALLGYGREVLAWPLGKTTGDLADAARLFRFDLYPQAMYLSPDASACAVFVIKGQRAAVLPDERNDRDLVLQTPTGACVIASGKALGGCCFSPKGDKLAWLRRKGTERGSTEAHVYDIAAHKECELRSASFDGGLRGILWSSGSDLVVWSQTSCYRWSSGQAPCQLWSVNALDAPPHKKQ